MSMSKYASKEDYDSAQRERDGSPADKVDVPTPRTEALAETFHQMPNWHAIVDAAVEHAKTLERELSIARSAGTRTVEPVWLWGLLQENPRPEVIQFAVAMERKLKANDDYKGRWDDCSRNYLLRRLRQETNELGRAVYGEKVDTQTVCDEAADVANFAMMIADVCAALPQMPALPTGTPRSATGALWTVERVRAWLEETAQHHMAAHLSPPHYGLMHALSGTQPKCHACQRWASEYGIYAAVLLCGQCVRSAVVNATDATTDRNIDHG